MRIVGGRHRRRALKAPAGRGLRPSAERLREALFDILLHAPWPRPDLAGAAVADLFAGTGALGLEALSRGARLCVFVENDRAALSALADNIASLRAGEETRVIAGDATRLPHSFETFDYVFLDPPYRSALAEEALAELTRKGWLKPNAVVALELAAREPLAMPRGYRLMDERRYGAGRIVILQSEA